MSSDRQTVLITGGNAGLGLEVVKALFQSSKPYHILVGCRGDKKRAEDAIAGLKSEVPDTTSTAEGLSVDISSDESIESAFKEVESKFGHIDILINNAGHSLDGAIAKGQIPLREAWNKTWDTNVVGTYIMTTTFIPLLIKSSSPKLLFVTSGLSSLTQVADGTQPRHNHPPAGWPKAEPSFVSYRSSKTGMNMMALDFVRILKNDGVKTFIISPGMLATGLGGDRELIKKLGAIDPAIGGNFIKDVVEGKRDEFVGQVIRKDEVQPW